MNSIFKVTLLADPKLQRYKNKAIRELNKFFNKRWVHNTPKVFVVDDRKSIDLLREERTENWVVGWSWGKMAIFVLSPKNISKESCHNGSEYDIAKLIKHELGHSFFQMAFGQSKFTWFNEGVSIYVAGQLDRFPMPKKFSGFLNGKRIYQESGNAIKLLVDNYGKDKLFEFLKKQSGITETRKLKLVFKEVFGSKLEYSFFNNLI
ncbi:hypothetical protein KKC62_03715 [Patescibacteria group bacterium]|nr:hypothetical protein [Patescibacteria group bacterium]MBU1953283.1 hypothetical protein [Patescibacteria group bacterium]